MLLSLTSFDEQEISTPWTLVQAPGGTLSILINTETDLCFFLLASSMQNSIILRQLNTVCLLAFCLGGCSLVLNVLWAV